MTVSRTAQGSELGIGVWHAVEETTEADVVLFFGMNQATLLYCRCFETKKVNTAS